MKDDFKQITTAQLLSNLYLIKAITIALICAVTLLLSMAIFGMATKEDNGTFVALFVVGVSCGAGLPLQFINMKKIKAELESRK
ncbi:MAG: hypothetical protein ACJAQX_001215 [Polaribacter sp.]|jgi:hypothetical protein|uniref:hypothetical protein n=1 Tax=Polaribacter sp. TaxID=1920175 RepID=UPI003ADB4389